MPRATLRRWLDAVQAHCRCPALGMANLLPAVFRHLPSGKVGQDIGQPSRRRMAVRRPPDWLRRQYQWDRCRFGRGRAAAADAAMRLGADLELAWSTPPGRPLCWEDPVALADPGFSTSGSSRNVTRAKPASTAGRETSRLTRTEPPEGAGPNSRSSANGKCPIEYVNLVRLIARS